MAVITLDWRETGSASVRRTFNSIFLDAQRAQREVSRLGAELSGLSRGSVRLNTQDSDRRLASLGRRAQELRNQLRAVNSQQVRVQVQSGGFREFSQSVSGAGQQLTAVQQRLVSYQQANAQLARSLGLPVASVRQLNTALGTLPGQTANVVARYTELRSAGESSVSAFRSLNTEFGVSQQQFTQLQSSIGLSTQALTALTVASGAVAVAIGGIFQGGARNFLAFERSLQGAAIRSGETREGYQAVADEAARLGRETALTSPQVAATADQLSRMGFNAVDAENALEGLVNASISSGEGLSTVTNVVGSALRQFNLGTEEAQRVGDLLSTAANRSNVSVSSLGESLKFVAPQARAANQSIEETTLALSLLGDNALKGGIGGRGLARSLEVITQASAASTSELAELSNGNEKTIGALQRLGTTTRDAAGNFLPLFDVLGAMADELNALESQADREVLLSALGGGSQGGRVLGTLVSTISDSPEAVARLRAELEAASTTAAAAAEEFQRGLPGAVNQIQSAFEGLQIRFFSEFQEEAELVVRAATTLVRTFLDLPEPIQSAVIATTALTGTLAAAVAIIAGYQLAVQTLGLANVSLSVSTVRAQAVTAAQTAVTAANTAAARSNAIAQLNVGTALNGIAAASGRAVAGFGAYTSALRANAAVSASGFGQTLQGLQLNASGLSALRTAVIGNPFFQAGVYAGVAASILAVADTFQRVTAGAEETRERIKTIDEALGDVARAQQAVADASQDQDTAGVDRAAAIQAELAQNTELAADKLGLLQRVFDEIREPISAVQNGIEGIVLRLTEVLPLPDLVRNRFQSLIDIFPQVATASEASTNRQIVAFEELRQETENVLNGADQLLTQGADASVLEAQVDAVRASISALEAERPVTEDAIAVRNAYLKILRQTETRLQAGITAQEESGNAVQESSDQIADATNKQAEAFDRLFNSVDQSLSATDGDELSARVALEEEKARIINNGGTIEAIEAVNQRILDSEASFNNDRIQQLEIAKLRLQELASLDPESANENASKILDIDNQLNQLRIENAQAVAEQAEELSDQIKEQEEQRLEDLRASFEEQAALIEANAQARSRANIALEQELVLSDTPDAVIRATVELAGLDDAQAQIREQISLEEQRRDAFGEGTSEQAQAIAQIDRLRTESDRNKLAATRAQIALDEAAEDARIENIQREGEAALRFFDAQTQAQANFFDQQEQKIASSARVFDAVERSLDNQNNALERRGQLLNAQASLQDSLDNSEVSGLERALDIRRQLTEDAAQSDGEQRLSAQERLGLERELQAITGSSRTTERQIQQELLAAEEQRSQNRLAALAAQQATERASLVLDQQRERLAAQRAIVESEIAAIQARAQRAALLADQARLQIQERTLRSELAAETDPEQQARLQGAIEQNALGQQAGASAIDGASQNVAEQERITELRREDLAILAQTQEQQRGQLEVEQQLASFQLLQSEAAAARATATELAATASRRLAATANNNALALERQRDAAQGLASALISAASASSAIGIGGGASLPAFRDGGVTPGGPVVVGEAGPEIIAPPQGSRVLTNAQSRQVATAAIRGNPALAEPFKVGRVAAIAPSIASSPTLIQSVGPSVSTAAMEAQLTAQTSLLREIQQANIEQAKRQRNNYYRGAG